MIRVILSNPNFRAWGKLCKQGNNIIYNVMHRTENLGTKNSGVECSWHRNNNNNNNNNNDVEDHQHERRNEGDTHRTAY